MKENTESMKSPKKAMKSGELDEMTETLRDNFNQVIEGVSAQIKSEPLKTFGYCVAAGTGLAVLSKLVLSAPILRASTAFGLALTSKWVEGKVQNFGSSLMNRGKLH